MKLAFPYGVGAFPSGVVGVVALGPYNPVNRYHVACYDAVVSPISLAKLLGVQPNFPSSRHT